MSQAVRLIKAGRSCGTLLYHISDDELGEINDRICAVTVWIAPSSASSK